MALFLQPPPPPLAPLSYSPPSSEVVSQFKRLVEQPLETALDNLVLHFQDLNETPNESTHYYCITRALEILGDESHRPVWPVLYPSLRFEDNLLKLLHGIRTEIKEIPAPLPLLNPPLQPPSLTSLPWLTQWMRNSKTSRGRLPPLSRALLMLSKHLLLHTPPLPYPKNRKSQRLP